MYKIRCAVAGCNEFPLWEIVWTNGLIYKLCDDHSRLDGGLRYDTGPDGTLLDREISEPAHRMAHEKEAL